jgi:hydrogenase maturation protease
MSAVAVLGIGNILQGDDGVGVRVVRELEKAAPPSGPDLYDGGTAPFDMIEVFLEHDRVIIVDCVTAGDEPGTVHRVTPEVLAGIESGSRFAHGLGVPETVRIARDLGCEAEVVVLGVEPAEIGWSLDLSDPVEMAVPRLVDAVRVEACRPLPRFDRPTA